MPSTLESESVGTMRRRRFLGRLSAAGLGLAAAPALRLGGIEGPDQRVAVGVIGLSRGLAHVEACLSIPGFEVAYVCDVDAQRLEVARKRVEERSGKSPQAVKDLRRILDDRGVDAVTIATCNHWHAPASILACAAGKHVYVEKPGSHNAREAELIVAAARRHQRLVQMGNQRRSWPAIREAIERLRAGVIGKLRCARCVYSNSRPGIGRGKPAPVPAHLDYALWQGPAPERPYTDNVIHYNWHWRWHWGNGELGNNGVHALDVARWGLDAGAPRTVSYVGGRYHHDDDQETPDTGVASYDFGKVGGITWEGSSCHPLRVEKPAFVAFYGDGGSLSMSGGADYAIYDLAGKEIERKSSPGGDAVHFENFLAAIRHGTPLNSEIGEAQKAAMLCHLGNISYLSGRTLHLDAATSKPIGDPEAEKLWGREYRKGWDPVV
jgi:predicted dehydrogenase